jgi:hypothetical protein
MTKLLLRVGMLLLWLIAIGMTGWAALAIYYSNLPPRVRPIAAALFPLLALAIAIFVRPGSRAWIVFFALFAVVLVWWLRIPPSNNRDWKPDVAVLPYAEINGNEIFVHNIRNCDYRTETDFDVHYYDKKLDLNKLQTADLYLVFWGLPVAHTMMSFGFDDGYYLCISIETRQEKGESYSALKGFFKQYELTYIVADERDLVRLRTNYRVGEDAYLYRLKAKPELVREVLVDYLRSANSFKDQPEWYNAMTSNCTTNIRGHAVPYTHGRFRWQILLNGYLDKMLYDDGTVDRSLPFEELKQRCYINPKAKAADKDPAFSQRIRVGIPGIPQTPAMSGERASN